MKIRYIKVLRELVADFAKNFMLVMAIAIGVLGIGIILGSHAVVNREMTNNYKGTNPASATIEVEDSISTGTVDSIRTLPGIKKAERHATLVARMKVHDRWYPLLLFVVDDFRNLQTNKFNYQSGAAEPPERTMLVERTALGVMQAKEGDAIMIKTAHGPERSVKLTGTVHDPGLAPAWQEQAGYGYITLSTLRWLGEAQGFDQLRIRVADHDNSRQHITKKAREVAVWLEKKGYKIHTIEVPPPYRHPHQGQMDAVMSIFIVFSFMILVLASILVATSMATLMTKQVRQIGIMKTIGANIIQIAELYLFMILLLCITALAIGIPLSRIVATILYTKIAFLLNLEITDHTIPYEVLLIQVSTDIIIPFIAAAFPVVRGSRIPIRVAMDNYGVSPTNSGVRWNAWLRRVNLFGETFTLSLRNVFRQRSRLIMTLGLLAAGGAMLMTAHNISAAWDDNLQRIYQQRLYDLDLRLSDVRLDTLIPKLKNIPGLTVVEEWRYTSASIAKDTRYEITSTYPDKGHGSFTIQALPVPTKLLNPTLTEGQWLNKSRSNDVVLNQVARELSPGIRIGDSISFLVDRKVTAWKIIGFTEDVGALATAYVSLDAFAKVKGASGQATLLRVGFKDRRKDYIRSKIHEIETLLGQENNSSSIVPIWHLYNVIAAHMRILVNTLSAMAILMAIVGTLGLMSTMSMNVMERTREIGVMRAIGATPQKINRLILWEGLAIGVLSILLAFPLSLLLSTYIGRFIGNMAFRTPLMLTISFMGCMIWVGIVVAGSYLATYFPSRRASRITIREMIE